MDFPIYRKYPNEKHYFTIRSETEFEELFIMGSRYGIREKKAENYPDRMLIQDMIEMRDGNWLESSSKELEKILKECQAERTPFHQSS